MKTTSPAPCGRAACGALLLSLAAAWPATARAYRPFDSTDAAVAANGELEIEFGPLGYEALGPDEDLVAPSVTLNWGFADRWEVVLGGRQLVDLGGESREPRERVEDAALSLKSVLRQGSLQGKTGISVATELSALLPTLHGDPGAGAEWALVVSERWPNVTLHVNGAGAWTRAHAPGFFGGIILEGHDSWAVRPVAEAFIERRRDLPGTVSGLVGAIWRATERLAIDAGLRRARAGGTDETEVRVGLTWGFQTGFPR